jgi:hypothetical protein
MEIYLELHWIFLRGVDRYKIDYSREAVKSRCVPGIVNIAFIINKLCWSGRRDSNPRPSAPKADALPGCATPRHSSIVTRIGFPLGSEQHPCCKVERTGRELEQGACMEPGRIGVSDSMLQLEDTAAIVQWQNACLWHRMSRVRSPLAAPEYMHRKRRPSRIPSLCDPENQRKYRA